MARTQRTPFVILGLLALSGRRPRSGYEIRKVIDTVISSFWHESEGQIYPALEHLAASGAIKVQAETKKGRKKTLYAITAEGRAQLRSWLAAPVEVGKPRDELILKLMFGSETEISDLIRHVEAHVARTEAGLAQCRMWEREGIKNPIRYRPFVQLTVRAGVHLCEANLRWAEETLQSLAAMNDAARTINPAKKT
jgi:DNA-binding PadR family transcriptional regulator